MTRGETKSGDIHAAGRPIAHRTLSTVLAGLVSSVVFLIVSAPAAADPIPSFGNNFLHAHCCAIYGGRASISGPGWNFVVPTVDNAGVISVTTQGYGNNHFGTFIDGFLQAGIVLTRITSPQFGCNPPGGPSENMQFTEIAWQTQITGAWIYQCKFWDPIGTSTASHRYSVFKRVTAENDDWSAYIDGARKHDNDDIMLVANGVRQPCCGSVGDNAIDAGGEFRDGNNVGCAKGTFGTSVPADWQRATAPGGNDWFNIQSSFKQNNTGDWNIGNVPGTFVVSSDKKHSCPGGGPTAVSIASFVIHGSVVTWRTGSETGLIGFEVWRDRRKLNRALIRAKGGAAGSSYRFVDRTPQHGSRPLYRLRSLRLDGTRQWVASARRNS